LAARIIFGGVENWVNWSCLISLPSLDSGLVTWWFAHGLEVLAYGTFEPWAFNHFYNPGSFSWRVAESDPGRGTKINKAEI